MTATDAHVGPRPSPKHSIDRIDNEKGYEPGNCRWATATEQDRNKSRNVYLEHAGRRMVLTDWARETGIKFHTLRSRYVRGKSPEEVDLMIHRLRPWQRRYVSDSVSVSPSSTPGDLMRCTLCDCELTPDDDGGHQTEDCALCEWCADRLAERSRELEAKRVTASSEVLAPDLGGEG